MSIPSPLVRRASKGEAPGRKSSGALLENEVVRGDARRLSKVATTVRSCAERLSWIVENLQRMARMSEPVDGPSEQQVEIGSLAVEVVRQLEEMAEMLRKREERKKGGSG